MFGNFAVNDDWIFVKQVEAFNKGIFTLNARIDPSFLFQGFLGLLWGKVFGVSFASFQILTFLVTLVGLVGFVLLLRVLKVKKVLILGFSLLYFFNPLIFTSAFSFMTDNYFLTLIIWSIYFYTLYFLRLSKKFLATAVFFALLSMLVRQTGVLLNLAFILSVVVYELLRFKKDFSWKSLSAVFLLPAISSVLAFVVSYMWPRFGPARAFIDPQTFGLRIKLLFFSLHYFPLFVLPMLIGIRLKISGAGRLVFAILVIFLFYFVFTNDIFPVGNVLYLEGLYSKSDFISSFSLVNNVFFKVVLSLLTSVGAVKLLFLLFKNFSFRNLSIFQSHRIFYILFGFLSYGVLLFSSDYYDRYLLPVFLAFLLSLAAPLEDAVFVGKKEFLLLFFFCFISFSLQYESSTISKLKWKQAEKISRRFGYAENVYVNNTRTNYMHSQKIGDYMGLEDIRVYDPKCFVQEYYIEGGSPFWTGVYEINDYVEENVLENPKPLDVKKKEIPRVKNNLDKLLTNEKYFSFLYNLVGRQPHVAGWCLEK